MKWDSWLVILVILVLTASNVYAQAQAAPVLYYLGFSPTMPPADSLAFRQALAYALDREGIAKAVTPHLTQIPQAAIGIQHPKLPGFNSAVQGYTYDQAKAKELYLKSGWLAPITILTPARVSKFLEVLHVATENSLSKALGTAVTLQPVANFNTLVNAVKSGSVLVYLLGWRSDPQDFGYPSFALGLAHTRISDPEIKALIEKRDAAAVEQMLLEKALIIPIIRF